MQKHKENLFFEKFSLLNSQEHNEDIKWSSSSSSDYENTSISDKLCNFNKSHSRKRKRKKKIPKNTSNLDITIIDTSKDNKKDSYREKSPIFVPKCINPTSPILKSSKFPPNKPNSPILSVKSLHKKSPILILKSASPKYSRKVRKALSFNEEQTSETRDNNRFLSSNSINPDICMNHHSQDLKNVNSIVQTSSYPKSESLNSTSDESESTLKAKLNAINKVKNYFDNYFSSENTSQNISDTPTPEKSIKNEPIEILTCRSQTVCSIQPSNHESFNSDTTNYFEKNKKVKYKKGGLAYRLNTLLKKQNAQISLWQHERFLAGTSNFIIPKGEHIVFCIRKVEFLYRCYLLDAVDVKNENHIIFINSSYVNNTINNESIFKLYEPYRILELDTNYKVVINVSKFECITLNKQSDNFSWG